MIIINALISITKLDWKPYALALAGFLCAVFADRLGEHYGIALTGILILLGWWLVLAGLLLAKLDDLQLGEIWHIQRQ